MLNPGLKDTIDALTDGSQKTELVINGAVVSEGNAIPANIKTSDAFSIDAFGRWRVSEPQTLFDSKNIFDDPDLGTDVENQPLFYDNQETAGTGTSTTYAPNEASQKLNVSASTIGTRVRQTKMHFNYQPGKSQLILMTFNLEGVQAGITKREGIFNTNNGLFLEAHGTALSFVIRSFASGSVVDTKVTQANWNVDKLDGTGASGITLDTTKTQILFIDFEWLGVGRVRMGFVVNGLIYYAHEFNNANNLTVVYMTTPNLPLRSEISNDGTGVASVLTQICSSVISEGGSEDLGVIRSASTDGTHVDATTENVWYAIIGLRLKANYLGASVKILNVVLQEQAGTKKCEYALFFNPTVAGTFTYGDETRSSIQVARGATANTVTEGFRITGGYFESGGLQSGNAGSADKGIDNALRLGSLIAGTPDQIVLCARPIGGTSAADIEGAITWRELL